ncbi:PACE efflux transporter [Amorphus sp. MBR-141]
MRTTFDRIRHAVSFELIALALVIPAGAVVFDKPIGDIGMVSLISATIATGWNYLYNLIFDHAMVRIRGDVHKTVAVRLLHALLFEGGLLLVLLPFIAWYLAISVAEAFLMDVSFAAFYLVYAFVYNWAYDLVFPIPAAQTAGE